jgi:hypothetical protein
VSFKDRARDEVSCRTLDAIANSDGFTLIRDTADDLPGLQNLVDCHADCMRWNCLEVRKPTFAHLLFSASFIENNDMVSFGGLEIGGWVVEG